jgi:hypothetical protein
MYILCYSGGCPDFPQAYNGTIKPEKPILVRQTHLFFEIGKLTTYFGRFRAVYKN